MAEDLEMDEQYSPKKLIEILATKEVEKKLEEQKLLF
jgi:hypothetical protein